MATITKKDLLEAIEDMPMDAEIWIETKETLESITEIVCDETQNEIEISIC
jgi:hypothetical protein